ncbi:Indoleamine 2,3-dioxygenase [Penicillium brevicompactum]|uniref:uncharacterized protein n=1 Tax=Penicillium brevicompactum TaxID=5074 RepID=UPI0025404C65|nr:uncharacterized protein N7506_011947 [Penicillium brevicompactum]KAJ5319243.1 hypothetical protein N7506_011947 [Penicillium brevicompactum]
MLQSIDSTIRDLFKHYAQHGFLPESFPLTRLSNPYYEPWETLASELPTLIQTQQIRTKVDQLPICSTSHLKSEPEWRRAYVIMGYLTHSYIWGGDKPKDRLPPSIAKPFLEISAHLELPACATYAGLTLWNFKPTHPEADITDPDNIQVQTSFTGAKDEEWFMVISVAVEAQGSKLISIMRDAMRAVATNDRELLTALLYSFADGLNTLAIVLRKMYIHNDPAFFYHQLRPLLAGSKNMGHAGLPRGVYYDTGDAVEKPENWLQLSGGSNAQSSLIQTLDIFLGITHSATDGKKASGPAFIHEMRNYMPGPHRRFLEDLTAGSTVRSFILSSGEYSSERHAYNAAVSELKNFRDTHIQMVTRYIVMTSRKSAPVQESEKVNLATASSQGTEAGQSHTLAGTGGTDLMPFLKQTRDTVRDAKC